MCKSVFGIVLYLLIFNTNAATIYYTDQLAFLANTNPTVFESFEQYSESPWEPTFDGDYFTASAVKIIGNDPSFRVTSELTGGMHPTHGAQYLRVGEALQSSWVVTIVMDTPIKSAGFDVIDFGDLGSLGSLSLKIPEIDEEVLIANGGFGSGLADGNVIFIGFETDQPISSFQLIKTTTADAFSLDSMYFAPVPIPAAVWLFGSGLLGLIGVARRRANA